MPFNNGCSKGYHALFIETPDTTGKIHNMILILKSLSSKIISWIHIVTINQLVSMYKNSIIGNHLKEYKQLREQIASDTNQLFEVSDNFLGDLRSLPKDLRTTFADLAHQSTLHAVDPAKAKYVPGEDAKELDAYLATNPSNKKLADRIEARLASMEDAHKRLRAMYVALPDTKFKNGKTARDLFDGLRQRYVDQTTLMFEAFEGRIGRLEVDADVKKDAIKELRGQLKTLLDRVYFPLFRAGDYTLNANKPDHQEIIELHKTERQQRKQAKLLRADGYTVVEAKRMVDSKDQKTVIATGAIKKLIESATANGTLAGDQLKALMDEIDQTIIKSMPDAAYRRAFIHRKGTAGYSNDFINAYANSMRRSSAHIANLRHADKIPTLIEDMKKDIKSTSKNTNSNTNALVDVVNSVVKIEDEILLPTASLDSWVDQLGFMVWCWVRCQIYNFNPFRCKSNLARQLSISLLFISLLSWVSWVGIISHGFSSMWPMGWVVLFGIPISIYLVLLAIVLALRNPSKEVRYLVSISLMWLFIIAAWSYVTGWNKNLSFERYFALYALPPIGVWLGFVLWKWSKAG